MTTGILQVLYLYLYVLLELEALLSFVTPYIAINFGISPDILEEPLLVSTPVGSSIIARRVYKNYPVIVS